MNIRQIFKQERFHRGDTNQRPLQPIDQAAWIWMPNQTVWANEAMKYDSWVINGKKSDPTPFLRFRKRFTATNAPLRFDVSGDERYVLLLDGQVISRGPHRGMVEHWYYTSYEITELSPGEHCLEAVCWQLGWRAPRAQVSWRGGFILCAEGDYDTLLTTGKTPWMVAPLKGTVISDEISEHAFGVGGWFTVTGTGLLQEEPPSDAWREAEIVRGPVRGGPIASRTAGWMLFPTQRPDQICVQQTPGRIVNAPYDLTHPFTVPAHTELDLWWDLENYYCAYPELEVSGGSQARIIWGWTESLRDAEGNKGQRNEWKGKQFTLVIADTFISDGRNHARFSTPWWRCGRWCRLQIATANEPLTIHAVSFSETHYPVAFDGTFDCPDQELLQVAALCRRTVQMCMHDMMFDCPFYEQLMYQGDTRIQLCILNALTRDERMQHFVLDIFDNCRHDNGMMPMSFPSRSAQDAATYVMCWIFMFKDYLMWHDNPAFLKAHTPGMHHALMAIALYENQEGLLENLPGWSFMDWVPEKFFEGFAPDGEHGVSSLNNLFYLMALQTAALVDESLGEQTMATVWQEKASKLAKTIRHLFWDESKGLLSDTLAHDSFSEHGQCLAILTDCLEPACQERVKSTLFSDNDLFKVSPYFAFYLFETYLKCRRIDLLMARLDSWRNFLAWGASTAFETQRRETRSDCHAWSAAPLYFYQTALAGVTPDAPFFKKVRIAPQPAGLPWLRSSTPCPQGLIEVNLTFQGNSVHGNITLPPGLEGTFVWNNDIRPLHSGIQSI